MVSIVIPTYNRGVYLEALSQLLVSYMEKRSVAYEIIFVDDGCTDSSAQVLATVTKQYPCIKAVILDGNYGQQNATLAGIRLANHPLVMTIDDDLRYGLSGIGSLIDAMAHGWDVVYGVPQEEAIHGLRGFGTKVKEASFNLFCNKPKDIQLTSFRIMSPSVVRHVKADKSPVVYISARVLQKTKKINNLEVIADQSMSLPTNYSLVKLMKVLFNVFRYYTKLGHIIPDYGRGPQYEIKEIYP